MKHKIGIYKITSKINNKTYIGSTKIGFGNRFKQHISYLEKNKHPNYRLQKDYNDYGITNFIFEAIETVDNEVDILSIEQKYINTLNISNDYNLFNSFPDNKDKNVEAFVSYINNKWLVRNIHDKELLCKYKIYKTSDRQEVVTQAIKYNILDEYKSRISFNGCIKFMQDKLGYIIENGRIMDGKKKYVNKLIVEQMSEQDMDEYIAV